MKDILNQLFEGRKLTKIQAKETLINIANLHQCNSSQIAAFITCYIMRAVSAEELEGFRDALLELCIRMDRLEAYQPMDLCGTGGDGKNAFNISTISAFVVAGAGIKVAKHGNYGVSSLCGSSNVMEYLGAKFTNDQSKLEKQLQETNITFLHAPLFHPALKNLAPIRKELGVKTFFNVLGPMVNPAFPTYQLVGVYSLALQRMYAYLYEKSNKNYHIVHSLDGFDEISLTSDFKIMGRDKESILSPKELGFQELKLSQLHGGNTIQEAASILLSILQKKGTDAQNNVVLANSGLAIATANPTMSLEEGIAAAKESLLSGKALSTFERYMARQ